MKPPAHVRQPPGQRLVEHDADRVPVTGGRERLAGGLLRGHVADRAGEPLVETGLTQAGGQPEVQHHDASGRGDEHVRRLDVAMHLARVMQSVQSRDELAQRVPQLRRVLLGQGRARRSGSEEPAGVQSRGRRGGWARLPIGADVREEVPPLDELHREEPLVLHGEELVEHGQVRVADVDQVAELFLEAQQRPGLDLGQGLQGHQDLALLVEGLVNDAHSPRADPAQDRETSSAGELLRFCFAHGRRPIYQRTARATRGSREAGGMRSRRLQLTRTFNQPGA
jgi:hypothetical protein